MTIARKVLEIASFWDQNICLSCEAIQPPEEDEEMPPCVKCGGNDILSAETVLQIADMVEGDEE